jgi:hypothetical protein
VAKPEEKERDKEFRQKFGLPEGEYSLTCTTDSIVSLITYSHMISFNQIMDAQMKICNQDIYI